MNNEGSIGMIESNIDNAQQGDDEEVVLYINTGYGNEVTLGSTMDAMIDAADDIPVPTWRELVDILGYGMSDEVEVALGPKIDGMVAAKFDADLAADPDASASTWLELMEMLGCDADDEVPAEVFERHRDQVADRQYFQVDNFSGAQAEAFDLIRSLALFPMDKDGNGDAHGVFLQQTLANGPRKTVWIEGEAGANWLRSETARQGRKIRIEFFPPLRSSAQE